MFVIKLCLFQIFVCKLVLGDWVEIPQSAKKSYLGKYSVNNLNFANLNVTFDFSHTL